MNIKVMYSKKSDEWATPKKIYNAFIKQNYYDPCPIGGKNGLTEEWKEKNFVNPPFSKIAQFIDKAIQENKKGKEIILLIPARTDTKYFHKLLKEKPTIIFIKGRLHYNDDKLGAPFPSLIIKLKKGGIQNG